MSEFELKRVLGLPAISFIVIGTTIGGGVFVFTGIAYNITGAGLPLAYALAVVVVMISMMPIAMLGSSLPTVGGNYTYPSRMVSPGLAFVGVWIYSVGTFFGQIPLYALGCADYVRSVFPGLSPTWFAVFLVTFFTVINILGVKPAAHIQGILVLILIAALLYYGFAGIPKIDSDIFTNIINGDAQPLLFAAALLTFTYFGANAIIELGGEIIRPGKTIPRAFLIAFPTVAVIYIFIAIITVNSLASESLNGNTQPLIAVAKANCSRNGFLFFVIGGAVLALMTSVNALFIFSTKSLLIIIHDRILPAYLGKIHKKFGTPYILLLVIWVLSVLGIICGFSLQTLASYAALGGLIIFFPIMLAALKFPTLYPKLHKMSDFKLNGIWLWSSVSVGILMVLFFGAALLFDLKSLLKNWWIFSECDFRHRLLSITKIVSR